MSTEPKEKDKAEFKFGMALGALGTLLFILIITVISSCDSKRLVGAEEEQKRAVAAEVAHYDVDPKTGYVSFKYNTPKP